MESIEKIGDIIILQNKKWILRDVEYLGYGQLLLTLDKIEDVEPEKEKEAANEIREVLKKHYPNLDGYYLDFVNEMVDYLTEVNEYESGKEKVVLTWTYPETVQVNTLNDAIERIKYHLLEKEEQHIWRGDKPKDEYEKGIYNAMRLLNAIVHWANPS